MSSNNVQGKSNTVKYTEKTFAIEKKLKKQTQKRTEKALQKKKEAVKNKRSIIKRYAIKNKITYRETKE